jgi:predicted nucleic acid-binding protein
MSDAAGGEADLIRVVLADVNVLYSRVLRDYLLYAADQEIVAIAWSSQILAEVTEHLMANVEGFDQAAAQRLTDAMNRAFPYAEVEPDEEHWRTLHDLSLPDEDDRHVLAASLAAEATVLCTSNTKVSPHVLSKLSASRCSLQTSCSVDWWPLGLPGAGARRDQASVVPAHADTA